MRDLIDAVMGKGLLAESAEPTAMAEDIDMRQARSAQDIRDANSGHKPSFASGREREIRNSPAFLGDEGPEKEREARAEWKALRAERLGRDPEGEISEQTIEADVEVTEQSIDAEVDLVQELAGEDERLEGVLDPRALAKLLPEVDKLDFFVNAVRKVMKGDIATLNIGENRQLAKAFISLLRDNSQTTMKVMQKLKMVHSNDDVTEEL